MRTLSVPPFQQPEKLVIHLIDSNCIVETNTERIDNFVEQGISQWIRLQSQQELTEKFLLDLLPGELCPMTSLVHHDSWTSLDSALTDVCDKVIQVLCITVPHLSWQSLLRERRSVALGGASIPEEVHSWLDDMPKDDALIEYDYVSALLVQAMGNNGRQDTISSLSELLAWTKTENRLCSAAQIPVGNICLTLPQVYREWTCLFGLSSKFGA